MEENVKVPFWQKTWVVVLACVFIPPAGLALLWVGKKGVMILRIILTVILAFYSLAWLSVVFTGGTSKTATQQSQVQTEVVAADTSPVVEETTVSKEISSSDKIDAIVLSESAINEYLSNVEYPSSKDDWTISKRDDGAYTLVTKVGLKETSVKQPAAVIITIDGNKYLTHYVEVAGTVFYNDGIMK